MEEENIRKVTRFIKSYKYKHKPSPLEIKSADIENRSCDTSKSSSGAPNLLNVQNVTHRKFCTHHNSRSKSRSQFLPMMVIQLLISLLLFQVLPTKSNAFCPFKCICDDQSLSANCTQVPSITTIPMTFNPSLKQLTLNHLPMMELSNSLSVYRRLEYLNLNSNLLHQIRYQNFNFKPAPPSVVLSAGVGSHSLHNHNNHPSMLQEAGTGKLPSGYATASTFELTNANNEQLARNLKQAIDKSISHTSGQPSAGGGGSSSGGGGGATSSEDEIRFHLRDMDLGDNRIDQLGSLNELDEEGGESPGVAQASVFGRPSELPGGNLRLRSQELERLAPFLTLTRLENLNLSGNRLIKLHQHVFLGLVNLKRLDLSRNQLEFIDRLAFVGLIGLELLKLDHNRLANHLQPMSLAFCRAPMMELRFLDLSNNYRTTQDQDVLLPNQMFICAPRLVSLRLDGLQLRYIQVNAFDNLQQLETLNLSRNYLEQVPSDPLGYSNSNLSLSLRQLDLSDNLIEFVNARSFGSLRNLQKLCLNQMARLVSFDLASLGWQERREIGGNLGYEVTQLINDQLIELQLRQNPRLQSLHSSLAARNEPPRGRLRFTKLRLLDLHDAVELRDFNLNEMIHLGWPSPSTTGNGDANDYDNLLMLQVDLSQVSKLNCSSCQMSWLVESAKQQHRIASPGNDWRPAIPLGGQEDPFDVRPTTAMAKQPGSKIILLSGSIGCSWPFAMPLVQLIDLETNFAPIFAQNCNTVEAPNDGHQEPSSSNGPGPDVNERRLTPPGLVNHGQQLNHDPGDSPGSHLAPASEAAWSPGSLTLAGLVVLVVIFVGSKVAVTLLFVRCRRLHKHNDENHSEFKWWRSPSLAPSSTTMESPSSAASTANNPIGHSSPADCSSSSILSSTTMANGLYGRKQQQQQQQQPCHQFERQHQHQQQQPEPEHQLGRKQQYDRGQQLTGAERQRQQLLEQLNNQLLIDGAFKQALKQRNNVASSMDVACRAGGSNTNSAAAAASASAGGGRPIQIEWRPHRQRRGNLFSRIAERLSAITTTSWRPSPLDLVAGVGGGGGGDRSGNGSSILGPDRKLLALGSRNPSASTSTYLGCPTVPPLKHFGTCIIENVVYGGVCDDKILASSSNNNNNNNNNNHISANETSPHTLKSMVVAAFGVRGRGADSTPYRQAFAPTGSGSGGSGSGSGSGRLAMLPAEGQADFIKPAYGSQRAEFLAYPNQMGEMVMRNKNMESDGGIVGSLDFGVYANCHERQEEVGGASSSLIMEPTSCSRQRKQMMAKQLGAIEMDPRKQMLAATSATSDSPQRHQLQHQSQWVHSTTTMAGTTNTCQSSSWGPQMEGSPRYSSGSSAGAAKPVAVGRASHFERATNSQVRPVSYLDSFSANGNNSSLAMDHGTVSPAKSGPKSKFGAGQLDPAGLRLVPESGTGHIYVTLDRPIKQQNGCDEYGRRYDWQPQQQQQQQRELQLEQLEIMQPESSPLATKANGARFVPADGCGNGYDNGAPTSGANCPAEDYKSFEWTAPFSCNGGGAALASLAVNLNGSGGSGPLESRAGDKFKLGHEEEEAEAEEEEDESGLGLRDCLREQQQQQQQQLVGQLGKLSSPLQKFEGNIRQQQPITLANSRRRNHRAPLPELPFEAIATEWEQQQQQQLWQFARVSPVATSGDGGRVKSGGQMYDNKNGHTKSSDSATAKGRKFKNKSKLAGEEEEAFAVGQATGYDNVTGHTDYHDDDDDDDDDVGIGIAQRAPNAPDRQLNGGLDLQQRQLFMDPNSLVETTKTTTSNQFRGPKWGLAATTTTTSATTAQPAAEVASLSGSLDSQAHHAGCASKYDANHGPKTSSGSSSNKTPKPAHNGNQPPQQTAGHAEGGRPPVAAPSDNPNYNCVINGLEQQQQQQQRKQRGYMEQNYGQVEMGVVVAARFADGQHDNVADRNRNGKTNNNNASNLSPISMAKSGQHSILIGQQEEEEGNFVARGSDYAAGGEKGSGAVEASDYGDDGQQKLCDNLPKASRGVGAMIRGPSLSGKPPKQVAGSPDSSPSTNSSQLAGNNNEIYSNQFYYCKPTTATLARESKPRPRRRGES